MLKSVQAVYALVLLDIHFMTKCVNLALVIVALALIFNSVHYASQIIFNNKVLVLRAEQIVRAVAVLQVVLNVALVLI